MLLHFFKFCAFFLHITSKKNPAPWKKTRRAGLSRATTFARDENSHSRDALRIFCVCVAKHPRKWIDSTEKSYHFLRLFFSLPKDSYGVAPTHMVKNEKFWKHEKLKAWTWKIGHHALTQSPPPLLVPVRARTVEGEAIFWQSHRSPMPLSNFRNGRRRHGPCCAASIGTTGSAPCAVACALVLVAGPLLEPPVPAPCTPAAPGPWSWLRSLPLLVRGLGCVRVRERTMDNFLESWKKRLKNYPSSADFSFQDRSRKNMQKRKENVMQNRKTQQNLDHDNIQKQKQNRMQNQQNWAKLGPS